MDDLALSQEADRGAHIRVIHQTPRKLAGLQQEQRDKQANAAWQEHNRIVRGNPVRTYVGEKFVLKKGRDGEKKQIQ